jgi:hypothetical protein
MRRNVFQRLVEEIPIASHAVVLTHNINFLFVQSVILPLLRAAGQPRLTIFADAACAAGAYAGERHLLSGLGVRYRVVVVDLGPGRRFHPKAILLCNDKGAAVAIGSGNLTHGGISANHEAWVFGSTGGEGADLISGLRDYIHILLDLLPLAAPVRDDIDAVFADDHAWPSALPPARALAMSPGRSPLLDQIVDLIEGDIEAVTVMAPYYDDGGSALAEISRRFRVPLTAYFQPKRAGLSKAAAATLPATISLATVQCHKGHENSFIHAKLIAFRRSDDVLLAIGSANCSRAALLADPGYGNAELMVVDRLSFEADKDFFEELVMSDTAPELPECPPSEDWGLEETPPLRILAARQQAKQLDVAFKSTKSIKSLAIETQEGVWTAERVDRENMVGIFLVPIQLRSLRLTAQTADGETLASSEAWVDDEASLGAPASLRRVVRELQEGQDDQAGSYRAVLDLFREYIRDPEAARRRMRGGRDRATAPVLYDPATVFSETFGRPTRANDSETDFNHQPDSILAIIAAMYSVSPEIVGSIERPPDDDGEEPDPDKEQAKLVRPRPSHDPGVVAQLHRALEKVEAALLEPAFVEARRPELLGADLALAAVLLVKGLAHGHLDPGAYRVMTRKLWTHLFFGAGGAGGAIPQRIAALDAATRQAFLTALASPRLSASLVLWSLTEWSQEDVDGVWFRMSAAQLQYIHPWLFTSAPSDTITAELQQLAISLLPTNEQAGVMRTWIELVRAGEALRLLCETLTATPAEQLRSRINSPTCGPADLVWQTNRFGLPIQTYRRDRATHAEVRFLGATETNKFRGDYLLPVLALLKSDNLGLPSLALEQIWRFASAATAAGGRAP